LSKPLLDQVEMNRERQQDRLRGRLKAAIVAAGAGGVIPRGFAQWLLMVLDLRED
jgi:hypothetical protein